MQTKLILISCDIENRLRRFPLSEFVNIQGALKMMTKENFEKLRGRILSKGIKHPPHVWMFDGKPHLIDGHGRIAVLRHMVEQEGYECPPIPAVEVEATSIEDAREEVLAASSNYNTMTKDGLHEYMELAGMEPSDLDEFALSEIDLPEFKMEFYEDPDNLPPAERDEKQKVEFEAYQNASIKQIVLYFAAEDYQKAVNGLDSLMSEWGLEDFSQVVWKLLNEKIQSRTPGN